jgi:hypothetical protein
MVQGQQQGLLEGVSRRKSCAEVEFDGQKRLHSWYGKAACVTAQRWAGVHNARPVRKDGLDANMGENDWGKIGSRETRAEAATMIPSKRSWFSCLGITRSLVQTPVLPPPKKNI